MVVAALTQLLKKSQVAALVGVTSRTIDKWLSMGQFPAPIRREGHHPRWTLAAVESWIHGRDVQGPARSAA